MRILIDTNVLLSAAMFLDGVCRKAYNKAVAEPNIGIVCDFSVEELKRVFNRKFPNMQNKLDRFLAEMITAAVLMPTPVKAIKAETAIRDEKDRPILRAAVKAKADAILSGDKDFLESGITKPKMVSPTELIRLSD